jgi:hypothetical protein
MMSQNRWVVSAYDDDVQNFPRWRGTIPNGRSKEDIDKTTRLIYGLAIEEDLYRVVNKDEKNNQSRELSGLVPLDFLLTEVSSGDYDMINNEGLYWYLDCEEQCKIAYYDLNGQVKMEWMGKFYELHRKLRLGMYHNTLAREDNAGRLPIAINYTKRLPMFININDEYIPEIKDRSKEDELYEIMLCSDIWFPRVVGWLDSEEPYYDNSELAALNTPRLNRFLQKMKDLILGLGGKWELVSRIDREAKPRIVHENGIRNKVYPPLYRHEGVENIMPECVVSEDGISLELDIKPKNYWCVAQWEAYLPHWEARFPSKKFKIRQDFWPLVKTVLEVGRQEEIFKVLKDETDFKQFIYDVEHGILPIPSLETLHNGRAAVVLQEILEATDLPEYVQRLQGVTKVSCYNINGKLVEKYVDSEELGAYLYNYHQGEIGDHQSLFYRQFLYRYKSCMSVHDHLEPEGDRGGCYLNIYLNSDIWFPILKGSMERKVGITTNFEADRIGKYTGGFDNRELANRHTPRLNRFISAISKKVIEMGGEWSIGADVSPEYRDQMTATGIKLDV